MAPRAVGSSATDEGLDVIEAPMILSFALIIHDGRIRALQSLSRGRRGFFGSSTMASENGHLYPTPNPGHNSSRPPPPPIRESMHSIPSIWLRPLEKHRICPVVINSF